MKGMKVLYGPSYEAGVLDAGVIVDTYVVPSNMPSERFVVEWPSGTQTNHEGTDLLEWTPELEENVAGRILAR